MQYLHHHGIAIGGVNEDGGVGDFDAVLEVRREDGKVAAQRGHACQYSYPRVHSRRFGGWLRYGFGANSLARDKDGDRDVDGVLRVALAEETLVAFFAGQIGGSGAQLGFGGVEVKDGLAVEEGVGGLSAVLGDSGEVGDGWGGVDDLHECHADISWLGGRCGFSESDVERMLRLRCWCRAEVAGA